MGFIFTRQETCEVKAAKDYVNITMWDITVMVVFYPKRNTQATSVISKLNQEKNISNIRIVLRIPVSRTCGGALLLFMKMKMTWGGVNLKTVQPQGILGSEWDVRYSEGDKPAKRVLPLDPCLDIALDTIDAMGTLDAINAFLKNKETKKWYTLTQFATVFF